MPSPFPGMDPFLEHPNFFPDLHGAMHVYIRESLQSSLPSPYFAVVNERLWVETSGRRFEPDTDVIYGGYDFEAGGGGTAMAVAVETRTQPLVIEVPDEDQRQAFVEIRTKLEDGGERVVTVIEILSLSNKTAGEKSQELYLTKQQEVLSSPIHLVEIDLLRAGRRTTAVERERPELRTRPFDYHVSISRFDHPTRFYVYPWSLPDPLPEIAIPLLPRDGEVALDLQAVFTRCYDTGPYRRRIDYNSTKLVPPLDDKRLEWVKQVLAK